MIISTDASFSKGIAGLSCIITDRSGKITDALMKRRPARDAIEAELLGIWEAVNYANSKNERMVTVISDSRMAVGFCTGELAVPYYYKKLVNKIGESSSGRMCFQFKGREENKRADALAVFAFRRGALPIPGIEIAI